jgi:hypothetical protein
MKVPKVFIFILIAFILSFSLSAHDFFAGVKLGPGVAFVHGDDTDDLDPKGAISVGLFGTYSPIKYFAAQLELNYELKGFSWKEDSNQARQSLHYFSIPLIAKGVFPVSIVTIQPYFGLNFSFLMDANLKAESSGTILGDVAVTNNNTDSFEVFDLGILFGGETFIKITDKFYITADLRFNIGVLEIVEDADIFNGTFHVLAGVAYKF